MLTAVVLWSVAILRTPLDKREPEYIRCPCAVTILLAAL